MTKKDVTIYNTMISGLAMNGKCTEAIEVFQDLVRQGLKPTNITFVGVLNACSHGGLVDLGFEIFNSMARDYGIEPQVEHYGCMVDLLGRVGCFEEAYHFIRNMKIQPDHIMLGALLSACQIHGNLELGEVNSRKTAPLWECRFINIYSTSKCLCFIGEMERCSSSKSKNEGEWDPEKTRVQLH